MDKPHSDELYTGFYGFKPKDSQDLGDVIEGGTAIDAGIEAGGYDDTGPYAGYLRVKGEVSRKQFIAFLKDLTAAIEKDRGVFTSTDHYIQWESRIREG